MVRSILIAAACVCALGLALVPRALVATGVETDGDGVIAAPPLSPQEEDIGRVVRSYLLKNPQVLREVASALQAKEAEVANLKRGQAIGDNREALYNSSRQVVLGNPNGDVTLVEFFDYNCGYCKHALGDMNALLDGDPKLKIVLKEFPVLSEDSRDAARVAVAINRIAPDKYLSFHRSLLGSPQPADGDRALAIAKDLGLDMKAVAADIADPSTDKTLAESITLAQALGIDGTPSYIVGDTVVPGAVGVDALKTMIRNTRSCGKATCT